MQSSHILDKLCDIRDKKVVMGPDRSALGSLRNFHIGIDEGHRKLYLSAEVWPDSLDNGVDLSPESQQSAKNRGIVGDQPAQYIATKLGGGSIPNNAFPLNSELDISVWKADEGKVYEHVKQGGGRHAFLEYGLEYDEKEMREYFRPLKIYYQFKLFEGDNMCSLPIINVIDNPSRRLTDPRYYFDPRLGLY